MNISVYLYTTYPVVELLNHMFVLKYFQFSEELLYCFP